MLHQSSYIMSLQTHKTLLPPWHNLTWCHNTSSQEHYYCCYFFSLPLHPQWYLWRPTEKYYWVSAASRRHRARLPRKLFAHRPGVETQTRSYCTSGAILVSHWGWHTALRPRAERVGSCLWGQWPWLSFPSSLQGCRSKGHVSTGQQVSSLRCTRASGRGNPEILPSPCSNNYEIPPPLPETSKEQNLLKEKLYMAKPLKSRGELDSSHNAGIFRW